MVIVLVVAVKIICLYIVVVAEVDIEVTGVVVGKRWQGYPQWRFCFCLLVDLFVCVCVHVCARAFVCA